MAPLRRCGPLAFLLTNPIIARRLARGLEIDVELANQITPTQRVQASYDEFEAAYAAKEIELLSMVSPAAFKCNGGCPSWPLSRNSISIACNWKRFPSVIDSFESFMAMKTVFLDVLAENNCLGIVPESKLYRSVYFAYG